MRLYRIIDLRFPTIAAEERLEIDGSPLEAAERVLGQRLTEQGENEDLAARVYWTGPAGKTQMMRLFRRPEGVPMSPDSDQETDEGRPRARKLPW